jgi:hypothetical protein
MPVWSTARHNQCLTPPIKRELTQMPFVANLRPATTDLVRQRLAEFARTLPHGFVPDNVMPRAASNSYTMRRPSGKLK